MGWYRFHHTQGQYLALGEYLQGDYLSRLRTVPRAVCENYARESNDGEDEEDRRTHSGPGL
jgi:hypothetical protein